MARAAGAGEGVERREGVPAMLLPREPPLVEPPLLNIPEAPPRWDHVLGLSMVGLPPLPAPPRRCCRRWVC